MKQNHQIDGLLYTALINEALLCIVVNEWHLEDNGHYARYVRITLEREGLDLVWKVQTPNGSVYIEHLPNPASIEHAKVQALQVYPYDEWGTLTSWV